MELVPTEIPEVVIVQPKVFRDDRGLFYECWNRERFAELGLDSEIVQFNFSRSIRHTLRGLHYQVGGSQGKLVKVSAGSVFDVAVDMRRNSATFSRWVGVELSSDTHQLLWIPPGFAHGVLVTSEHAEMIYGCTEFYSPSAERTVGWDDLQLGITWPLPTGIMPLLSERDRNASRFCEAEYL